MSERSDRHGVPCRGVSNKIHLFIVTKPSRPDLITIAIDHTTFVIA